MTELGAALVRVPSAHWRESQDDDGVMRWLPLVLISDSGLWIGLDAGAAWVVGRPEGRAQGLAGAGMSPSWLPMLDYDENVFMAEMAYAAEKFHLPGEPLAMSVPIDDVLALAVRGGNSHWVDRAMAWLEHRAVRPDIAELLPRVVSSKAVPQRARQIARKLH